MTLVSAGFGIEDDDAPVAIAVGHIDLMHGLVHVDVGRAAEVLRVVAAFVLSGLADLHDELAIEREFQDLAVLRFIAADPDEIGVVHEDAMLRRRPFISASRTAPGANQLTLLVELQHWRRWKAALADRRVRRCAYFSVA